MLNAVYGFQSSCFREIQQCWPLLSSFLPETLLFGHLVTTQLLVPNLSLNCPFSGSSSSLSSFIQTSNVGFSPGSDLGSIPTLKSLHRVSNYHLLANSFQIHSLVLSLWPEMWMSSCLLDIFRWLSHRLSDSVCIKYNLRCAPLLPPPPPNILVLTVWCPTSAVPPQLSIWLCWRRSLTSPSHSTPNLVRHQLLFILSPPYISYLPVLSICTHHSSPSCCYLLPGLLKESPKLLAYS